MRELHQGACVGLCSICLIHFWQSDLGKSILNCKAEEQTTSVDDYMLSLVCPKSPKQTCCYPLLPFSCSLLGMPVISFTLAISLHHFCITVDQIYWHVWRVALAMEIYNILYFKQPFLISVLSCPGPCHSRFRSSRVRSLHVSCSASMEEWSSTLGREKRKRRRTPRVGPNTHS